MSIRSLTSAEKYDIAVMLEGYHRVFSSFFNMSDICFSDRISTACVRLPKRDKPTMFLNEDFWNSLSEEAKVFVVCHECLHTMLNHGMRAGQHIVGATPELVNQAQDITINEMLYRLFEINRLALDNWEQYCWIETCFPGRTDVLPDQTYDYYLELMVKGGVEKKLFDDHEGDGDELSDELMEKLKGSLSPKERASMEAGMSEGYTLGGGGGEPKKINFTKLVARLAAHAHRKHETSRDTFARTHRRYGSMGTEFLLPGPTDVRHHSQDRLITAAFMDVSGSCLDYVPDFDRIREAFLAKPDLFDLRTFIFTTQVQEVHPKAKEIGISGGTAFAPIERQCRKIEDETGRYPDCVVIITDGMGSKVKPKWPKRWIWLLTPGGSKKFIHPDSRQHFIADITY